MRFEFATATRIIFGAGARQEIGALAAELGSRALIVTGRTVSRAALLLDLLISHGVSAVTFTAIDNEAASSAAAYPEPTTDRVMAGVNFAREENCDLVIGFGGGAALDTGKAIAALLTNGGEPLDYLEVIGRGQPVTKPAAPYIAIPTTAGTGTEVTKNAVLASPQHRVKVSLRSPLILPRLAVIDPELTYTLPPHITVTTGLDAFTQVLEPFVSRQANPVTDGFCREGMRRVARALRRAYENGSDAQAREDMALASLLGGLALANAKLGAVHGFAGVFGGMFHTPHGAVCAALLPHVMDVNVRALQERMPDSLALRRYDEIAQILTGNAAATAADAVRWIEDLCAALHIPALGTHGCTAADIPPLVEKSGRSSSMKGNPIQLTPAELEEILTRAL